MTRLLDAAATACTVAGVLASAGVLVRLRDLRQAVGVLLDLLLAAGLLRLTVPDASWTALAAVALVMALRRVVATVMLRPQPGSTADQMP